jgi:hypothetical protein
MNNFFNVLNSEGRGGRQEKPQNTKPNSAYGCEPNSFKEII